ncbi:hypothetical protein [uncultured Paraglaciecola sp.]|uniref:hypothetical protein n=1 Tax=uncultured Paraglaciecola sp. TaxID=1765024 RepID=UPI00262B3621|nr:hypothetical protein [uncultured Paraglaciecola sp.]
MPATFETFFLFLNASILWGVLAGLLTWLLRFKTLVLVLLLSPLVMGSSFRHIAGMPELIGFYGTSLLYGAPGIIAGMLYADYQRTKAYFVRVSKTSFLARGGIGLSSVYLLGYFGQKIIFENPMVELVLGYIKGGDRAKEIVSQVDYDGALTAGGGIVACAGVLAFNTYREHRRAGRASVPALKEEQETGISS